MSRLRCPNIRADFASFAIRPGNRVMSINSNYVRLIGRLGAALPPLGMAGLYLPALVEGATYREEFGFLFLDDGSVGRFYVSLGSVLSDLWLRYPRPAEVRFDPVEAARACPGAAARKADDRSSGSDRVLWRPLYCFGSDKRYP